MGLAKINLIGQTYIDNIFNVDNILYGDTNKLDNIITRLGGVHNITDNIKNLSYNIISTGNTQATIINDIEKSERTSFTSRISDIESFEALPVAHWTHVAYLDDIKYYNNLNLKGTFSIDFCTCKDRSEYLDIMRDAYVIFDSRERSYLYDSIKIDTPIILHDPNKIQCIINGEVDCDIDIEPIKNLKVNGAGDIFAGNFISLNHYRLTGRAFEDNLRRSLLLTHHLTVKTLKDMQDEKI